MKNQEEGEIKGALQDGSSSTCIAWVSGQEPRGREAVECRLMRDM